jgi:uncharacterized protein YjbI with pentapeptide repeats
MEIVDAKIKATSTISNVDLINCEIEGVFDKCNLLGTDAKNSQLSKCTITHSEIDDSKVINCKVDGSSLINCYFMDGFLNGEMHGGVFRSGDLGPYASLDSDVKIVNEVDNFFNTRFDDDSKGDKKGKIPGFGKK